MLDVVEKLRAMGATHVKVSDGSIEATFDAPVGQHLDTSSLLQNEEITEEELKALQIKRQNQLLYHSSM